MGKRAVSLVVLLAILVSVLPLSSCAKSDWSGEWNRVGDATYSRAVLTIGNVGGSGFDFSMTLYNGNVAGRLLSLHAVFTDRNNKTAVYDVPDTRASITFSLTGKNALDVQFFDSSVMITETEEMPYSHSMSTEAEMFGFEELAYVGGSFVRGEVEYLNKNLFEAGVLDEAQSDMVDSLIPDDMMIRCLDCFQLWTVGDRENSGKHDDEIGGFVYYGYNTMQDFGAIIIAYDDNTVSVAILKTDGSIVYYSNNDIYTTGAVLPLPIKKWMEDYNAAKELEANSAKPKI